MREDYESQRRGADAHVLETSALRARGVTGWPLLPATHLSDTTNHLLLRHGGLAACRANVARSREAMVRKIVGHGQKNQGRSCRRPRARSAAGCAMCLTAQRL